MNAGPSDSVSSPCAIVVPSGLSFARSGSTWIHCWSPVASANASIFSCGTSIQLDRPNSAPGVRAVSVIPPPYDTRSPGGAGAGGEQEDELAVVQRAGARRAVEREQRIDAAHVPGVVEVGGARLVDAQLRDERPVHRRLHVDAAEVADVGERRAA